jgi:hypothetical protein
MVVVVVVVRTRGSLGLGMNFITGFLRSSCRLRHVLVVESV